MYVEDAETEFTCALIGQDAVEVTAHEAVTKADGVYCDATGDGVAWYRLTDLVRATIEYPELDTMYTGLRSVDEHFGKDVREFNDRYQVRLSE